MISFFIKCLVPKIRTFLFPLLGLRNSELFYFFPHDSWCNTVHTASKLQIIQGRNDGDEK